MEFKRAMCFVALGVCALSLQGCGDSESSSNGPYESAMQPAKNSMNKDNFADLKKVQDEFQKKGGCTAFRAVDFKARSQRSTEVAEAVLVKVKASTSCSVKYGNNLKNGMCEETMTWEAVDIMLFTAEKLPGFLTWKEEHKAWWTENNPSFTAILKFYTGPAIQVVQKAMPEDATLETIDWEWLKGELEKVNFAALNTLCPNTVLAAPQTARRLESDLLV